MEPKHEPNRGQIWIDYTDDNGDALKELAQIGQDLEKYYQETGQKIGYLAQVTFFEGGVALNYRSTTFEQYLEVASFIVTEEELERLKENEHNRS